MIVFTLIVVTCLVLLSSLVASQGFRKMPNRALLISISLLGTWIVMVFGLRWIFDSQINYQYQLLYSRLIFAAGALSLLSLVWFVSTLLSFEPNTQLTLRATLLFSGTLILGLCISPYIISDVTAPQNSVMPLPGYGRLLPIYIATVVATILSISYMVIWRGAREKDHHRRQQVRVTGITIFLAITAGAITNLVVPLLTGDAQSSLFMAISILILMIGLSYAIVRHGLFDIKFAAVRSSAYLLSLFVLAAVYYLAAYFISKIIFKDQADTAFRANSLDVFLALGLAFIFQPVKHFFDRITNKVFYRNGYDTGEFLIRLGHILTSTTELHIVLEKVGQEIRETLKANSSLFLVYRDHHPNALVGEGIDKEFLDAELSLLHDSRAAGKGGLLITDKLAASSSLDDKKVHAIFSKKHIALALPLLSADETIGFLMLGEHKAGIYTKQDIEALRAIANELVIAVQNARSVQAIRDLNANLEQRVDSATHKLRVSNKKLIALDEAKDEFVSMASHQLRTPLTSVKGYISMVLEGDAGKITPAQKRLLEEAFTSSERMVHLISDFLNVSRLQTGKFVIDKSLVNLADLVGQEIDGLKATAEARGLKLQYRKPSVFPLLYIDEGKLRQVLMNFIDNAIYYSMERTTITVKLRVEDGNAVLEVHDTGIGVPQDEQQRLFTKFFRATNARRQRPDGTGIGLFLAKKVVVAHGGSMVFESTEGEGSVFGFRLPIKKLSEVPATHSEPVQK